MGGRPAKYGRKFRKLDVEDGGLDAGLLMPQGSSDRSQSGNEQDTTEIGS